MHKMVHSAMLQTTKYCSLIQVKTHSTMLAIAAPQMVGFAQIVRVRLIVLRVVRERSRLWRLCFLLRALKILFNSVICESQVANLRVEL